jgi:hypothetical protein
VISDSGDTQFRPKSASARSIQRRIAFVLLDRSARFRWRYLCLSLVVLALMLVKNDVRSGRRRGKTRTKRHHGAG